MIKYLPDNHKIHYNLCTQASSHSTWCLGLRIWNYFSFILCQA